jgi:hypothetical protein
VIQGSRHLFSPFTFDLFNVYIFLSVEHQYNILNVLHNITASTVVKNIVITRTTEMLQLLTGDAYSS